MAIDDETHAWRRNLPHLQRLDRTYFITFVTAARIVLSDAARDAVLETIINGHLRSYDLYVCVVMPDHVHMIAMIYAQTTLPAAVKYIKSVSTIRAAGRGIWQREYFDRIVRHQENLFRLGEYVLNNPVRAGLVESAGDYPWTWRRWVEGNDEGAPQRDCGAPKFSP
jgi:REP element-mobilizing transposase RayT